MMNDLKPYPAMKDSGVSWIGDVPQHWEIKPLKRTFNILNGSTPKSGEPSYWDGNILWATPEDLGKLSSVTLHTTRRMITQEGYQSCGTSLAPEGSLVLSTRAPIGHLAIAGVSLCTNQGCHCLVFQGNAESNYYYYQLLIAKEELESWGQGSTFKELSRDKLKVIRLASPPIDEQTAIVSFLDHADRQIRHYIRAKQKLIKLLEEQKQVIIHWAVTCGLDPNVRLKPSDIKWLGDVPEHWEVVPFKHRVGFQEGPGIMAVDFRDTGVPLLRISCLRGDVATLEGCDYLDQEMVKRRWSHFMVQEGDYLLSASASTGAVALAPAGVAGSIPYTGIIRLWPNSPKTVMGFVKLFIECRPFQEQIDAAKSGVAIEHFGPTHLKRMWIALPPVDEQRAIVKKVASLTVPFSIAVESTYREISLVREYRTRLIVDVVTGKLDVREAAEALFDDDEPVIKDEGEEMTEAEETGSGKT